MALRISVPFSKHGWLIFLLNIHPGFCRLGLYGVSLVIVLFLPTTQRLCTVLNGDKLVGPGRILLCQSGGYAPPYRSPPDLSL